MTCLGQFMVLLNSTMALPDMQSLAGAHVLPLLAADRP